MKKKRRPGGNSGREEGYTLEIIEEDSFEEEKEEEGVSPDNKKIKKKSRLKRWQKICIGVAAVLIVLIGGLAGSFMYLRAKGEKNLKVQVSEAQDDESAREGIFITYNGKEYQYNENIINFLCLGIDKDIPIEQKRDTGSEGLADAVLLVSVDVEDNLISLLAIPRDTIVPVKVQDAQGNFVRTENGQITLQYAYGKTAEDSCELMLDAVSNLLYKVPIQRYCSINFQAVPTLNDAIGGVDVEVLEDIWGEHCTLYQGTVAHLDGYEALDYIRWRAEWEAGSSMTRLERQKQYMSNYFAQAKEAVKSDLTLPVRVFGELSGNMCTNVTVEDISYLVPELLDISLDMENIAMIPGEVYQPGEYEEYYVYEEELKQLVVNMFYEEVAPETENAGDTQNGAESENTESGQSGAAAENSGEAQSGDAQGQTADPQI